MGFLTWIAVGFATACVVGVYITPGLWLVPLGLCTAAGILASACLHSKFSKGITTALCGFLAGICWLGLFQGLYLHSALNCDGDVLPLQVELTDYSYETDYGTAADGVTKLDGKSYRIRIYLDTQRELSPGDVVAGDFLLRYTADGGSRKPTYHQGMGIFLIGYGEGEHTIQRADRIPVKYTIARLTRQITEHLDRLFPRDTAAFARALFLGDDRLLPYETDKALQISGIRHVIAVSGLHISILFALVYMFCGKRRVLTALLGIPALLLFAAVAGFTPSIVRACVMQCVMILAMVFNREYDPPAALALAVLILLAINPLAITSVSFQLSVASMLGIFLLASPISRFLQGTGKKNKKNILQKVKSWIILCVSVTLSTMVTTVPLCAYYFGCISLVSIPVNLLTLWVVSFIFYGILLACVLGAIWLPLGSFAASLISWPIRYVLMIANFFSKLPYSAVYTSSVYIVAWLVFCYVLLMVFLRCKKKNPALFAGCIVLGLVAAIVCTTMEKQPEGFSVTVMDVGQGQCVLLQTQEEAYLVDCGNTQGDDAADTAIRELLTREIYDLDGLILTHYDKDHAGGVNALLSWIPAERLYLPDVTAENDLRSQIENENRDIISWVTEIARIPVDGGLLTIFPSSQTEDANDSGLCILFQVDDYDILITGDRSIAGEEELFCQTELPELELLIAGHHGSDGSTGLELLSQTRPITVAISVGEDNSYGHPHRDTLERLRLFDCNVLRTDQMGTITFRG